MTDDSRTADANDPNEDPPPATEPAERVASAARIASRLGRYQLVLPLAQGGMGVVFAARLLGSHGVERLVAIKTLRPITSKSDRAALLREAKLTARLHHRNVVATIDLGEVDDVPYVVMELVDGVPLSRLLSVTSKSDQKLSPELCAWIVMQAALGLHAAHELTDAQGKPLGLVHRDVSPQNILLSVSGDAKIADFGIAKFAGRDETTATGMIKGKFAYMSPEQASDENVDRRSDVFALGIVLWEALSGTKLFSADTPARTIMRVLEHKPKTPIEVRPSVGEELSAITMRCLAKDPKDRYDTAAALADALRGALRARGEPVDEGDLAKVVTEHFGEERAQFMDRLHNADPDALTRPSREHPLAHDATGHSAMSVSSGAKAAARPPRSRGLVAAVIVAIVAAGVVVWRVAGDDPAKGAAGSAAAAASAPASASASASASATASASASATASASASASATASGSHSAPPVHTARNPPSQRPSAVPAVSTPPAPSAKPPPTANTGKPFDSL